jgi:hypothetical protein
VIASPERFAPIRNLAKLSAGEQRPSSPHPMKNNSFPSRSSRLQLAAILGLLVFATGCATRNTMSGGKETTVLGGAVTVATESFQPTPPTTIDVDTSKMVGQKGPSGKKVSVLWGLLTFHDY